MPKFTRRHYVPVAEALKDAFLALGGARVSDEQRTAARIGMELAVVHVSSAFAADNPAFSAERFKAAVFQIGEDPCKVIGGRPTPAVTSNPSAQLTFDLGE